MSSLVLFDFSSSTDWSVWEIQNDVVMGGNSTSELSKSKDDNAIFTGSVSLENNGGFASMQYHFEPKDIQAYEKAVLRLKGDGKEYQFRIKANLEERVSYVYKFKTSGDWQTIEIPLNKMEPVYRGNKLNQPNFDSNKLQEVRFMIGNGRKRISGWKLIRLNCSKEVNLFNSSLELRERLQVFSPRTSK